LNIVDDVFDTATHYTNSAVVLVGGN
jgi:hypothetical protein